MFVLIGHSSFLLSQKAKAVVNFFVFDGVSIFFVLSGFLIGGILIKTIDKNGLNFSVLKAFWYRRWFRTLPNYFLILSTLCVVHYFFDASFAFRKVFRYFIFSQNIATNHPDWFFPETWSLSIEEWFYLILSLLALFFCWIKLSHKKSLLIISIIVINTITIFRYYKYLSVEIRNVEDWDLLFRKQVATRLDSLMYGVIGAYIKHYYYKFWIRYKKTFLVAGIIIFLVSRYFLPYYLPISSMYFCVYSFTVISIGTLFLLPFLSELRLCKGFLYKPVSYLSVTSYSLYLINLSIVQRWIIESIPWRVITSNYNVIVSLKYLLFWSLSICLSIGLYKYFEAPMTSIRERIS